MDFTNRNRTSFWDKKVEFILFVTVGWLLILGFSGGSNNGDDE